VVLPGVLVLAQVVGDITEVIEAVSLALAVADVPCRLQAFFVFCACFLICAAIVVCMTACGRDPLPRFLGTGRWQVVPGGVGRARQRGQHRPPLDCLEHRLHVLVGFRRGAGLDLVQYRCLLEASRQRLSLLRVVTQCEQQRQARSSPWLGFLR